jgi:regulator of chromosome condensation
MEIANAEVPVPRVAITEPTRITFPEEEGGEEPKIVQVAVGTRQNLAVSASGHVYSFGTGVGGQLGQGDPGAFS